MRDRYRETLAFLRKYIKKVEKIKKVTYQEVFLCVPAQEVIDEIEDRRIAYRARARQAFVRGRESNLERVEINHDARVEIDYDCGGYECGAYVSAKVYITNQFDEEDKNEDD